MLKSKDLKVKAWESLKGKYWLALAAVIISYLLVSISTGVSQTASDILGINQLVVESGTELTSEMELGFFVIFFMAFGVGLVGFILSIFIQGPALVGGCKYFIKNTDSKPSLAEVFSGFTTSYGRNAKVYFLIMVKLFLWSLLFLIPGLIKSFEYAIIPYILADDPEIKSKDAFKKAKEMMNGNKWRLFKLEFSFIGWYLVCVAIGMILMFINPYLIRASAVSAIFLLPYIDAANAEFYVELKNK